MQTHLPQQNLPEILTYAIVAAVAIDIITAILIAATWPHDVAATVLVLAVAVATYWAVGRNVITMVSAKQVAAGAAFVLGLCGILDLIVGFWWQGIPFLLGAIAAGIVFFLLQQGTTLFELRFGNVVAIAASRQLAQLRMLDELHAAGVLTTEEYAAKRLQLGL